ncbi:MAG: low specificity L-threonine aldolase [Aestuariivirga sp.]
MNFNSDNVYGVHPKIMDAIVEANSRLTEVSYCHDDGAAQVDAALSKFFEKEVKSFAVMNGTGANSLALSAICPSYGGIFCHEASHINTDECNCPELFSGGAKLIAMAGRDNKLVPAALEALLKNFVHGEHGPKPSAISLSQVTELGTVYSVEEIRALTKVAKAADMKSHMDGARFANALVSLGCTPAEMTWKAGIDVLSFGGTKNGGMILESVVFFDAGLAENFLRQRKRAGQLLSKGRFLSAQMLAYLKDGLWLENAKHANSLAGVLAKELQTVSGVRLAAAVQANEIFVIVPQRLSTALEAEGGKFHEWPFDGLADGEVCLRLVLSFATPEADVQKFASLAKRLGN